MSRTAYAAIIVLHLFLVAVFQNLNAKESFILYYGDQDDESFQTRLLTEELGIGESYYSHKRLMLNCVSGSVALDTIFADIDQRKKFAKACDERAEKVLAMAPVESLAWLVRAYAARDLEIMPRMSEYLIHSWQTAPHQQWLAKLRYSLAIEYVDDLTPAAAEALDADLQLLAQSKNGVAVLAERYVQDIGFRERITSIVSRLPAQTQATFLSHIRQAVGQR